MTLKKKKRWKVEPQMFRDEPIELVLASARKISDLKNLGPSSEQAFAKAGIKSSQALIKMGWKKAMQKLVESDPRNCHSMFAYAIIGALQNKEWNAITETDKKEAQSFCLSLRTKKKNSK